nr:MAG TPA: hypothetical protein [Caudoviricetes sp.]
MSRKEKNMSTSIIITAIICTTIVLISFINKK